MKVKEWYTCELPNGEILTYTLEECKKEVDDYLRGECEEFWDWDSKYVITNYDVEIFKHTEKRCFPKKILCRGFYENGYRDNIPVSIDYGIFGFMSEWEEVNN